MSGLLDQSGNVEVLDKLYRHMPRNLPVLNALGPRGYTLLLSYVNSLGSKDSQHAYIHWEGQEHEREGDRAGTVFLSHNELRLLRLGTRSALVNRAIAAMQAGVQNHISGANETTTSTSGSGESSSKWETLRRAASLLQRRRGAPGV